MKKEQNGENQEIEIITSKKKRYIRTIILTGVALIIVAAVAAAIFFLPEQGEAKKVTEALRLGEKYLSELEYERAIASYQMAIQIDPKCVDAYIGLADVYLAMDKPEEAARILAEAEQTLAGGSGTDEKMEADLQRIRGKKEEAERKKGTLEPTAVLSPGTAFTPSGTGGRVTFSGNTVEISEAKVGDTVRFGNYEQDNDRNNGAEAIEWLVLDKQDGRLLLLSKDALDCKKYNEKEEYVTWETCTLRRWLNQEFYNTAFSLYEQRKIAMTKVKNEDNPYNGIEGGNDTEDKVFLLSIGEVLNYFDPDPDAEDPTRCANVTVYAEAQGNLKGNLNSIIAEYAENVAWWLRSTGEFSDHAVGVDVDGSFDCDGGCVESSGVAIRPAFWLNLEGIEENVPVIPAPVNNDNRVFFTGNTASLFKAKIGDMLRFGKYEQDNNMDNGLEDIEWYVLDKKDDGKLLLFSKYVLDCKEYNEKEEYVTWETCTLRRWLNDTFYNTAFSEAEKEHIVMTRVKNENNPYYGTEGGNDTLDKIFLLSICEVLDYFDSDYSSYDSARWGKMTEYAKMKGGWVYFERGYHSNKTEYDGNSWWWLRSPGFYRWSAAGVDYDGYVNRGGKEDASREYYGVRPAFWIDLES